MKLKNLKILFLVFIHYLILSIATKTHRQILEITNLSEFDSILPRNSNHTFLFVGDKNTKDFKLARMSVPKSYNLYWSSSTEIYAKFSIPNNQAELIFFRLSKKQQKHKEGVKINLQSKNQKIRFIKKAVSIFIKPTIELINDKNIDKLIEPGYPSLIIIKAEKANTEETNEYINILSKLEKLHRGNLQFYLCNYDEDSNNLLIADVFHVKIDSLPTAVIIDGLHSTFSADLNKYIFPGKNVTLEEMKNFIHEYKNNNLERILVSEDLPENAVDEYGIWKIVTKNVDNFMEKRGTDILLFTCIDSRDCNIVRGRLRNIFKKTIGTNSLIISELNPKINEIDSIYTNKIPQILFYPDSENRVKYRQIYKGSFTSKDILGFIKKHAKHPIKETKLDDEERIFRDEYKVMVQRVALHNDDLVNAMKNMNITDENNNSTAELDSLKKMIEEEEYSKEGEGEYVDADEEEEQKEEDDFNDDYDDTKNTNHKDDL